jgi:hypothetical protein
MNYALFRKPSRYIGNEINCIKKEGIVKVALCFPDTYEIGMSHIGLKILYHRIFTTFEGIRHTRLYPSIRAFLHQHIEYA